MTTLVTVETVPRSSIHRFGGERTTDGAVFVDQAMKRAIAQLERHFPAVSFARYSLIRVLSLLKTDQAI
jgi:hypothetical protein